MSQILVSRTGEDFHEFSLDDIKRGAIRDSGLFPEMYERPMPPAVTAALISGVERKLEEHRVALKAFDLPVYLPPALLPRALEDSKEEQEDQVSIAKGKLERGFLSPVFGHASTLSAAQRRKFFAEIARRAEIPDISNLIVFADDRGKRNDPVFKERLYGHLKEHSNSQIREVFDSMHETPGKRVKEVDGANLGVLNSVHLYHAARRQLIAEGVDFDPYQYMDTTLCFVPMMPKGVPLPEQGLVIKSIGNKKQMREITEHDLSDAARGRILTYDHFDKPIGEDFPEWVTLHGIKKVAAGRLSPAEERVYGSIDSKKASEFLSERDSPGAAMTAFVHAMNIPRAGASARLRPVFNPPKGPKVVLTTGNFLTLEKEDIAAAFPVNSSRRVSRAVEPLTLRNLETMVHMAQAFAVVDPDKYPIRKENIKIAGSEKMARLIRALKTSLVASYLTTMSTQAGASQHIGRPHLVDRDWHRKYGLYHPDLCNMGLTGDTENEAYRLVKDKEDVNRLLSEFDPKTYQHDVSTPPNQFMSEKAIKEVVGKNDLGYVVAVYGSSNGFAEETYTFPKELTSSLSRLKNVTTVDGAGVRSGMKGMKDGAIEAIEKGYKVLNLGFRSETDVSPLEGNHADYFDDKGYPLKQDEVNERHETAANGQLHVFKLDRILPRQAAIAEIAHAAVICDGGKGTVLEFYITALHNASLNITGKGLLGHTRHMPLVVMNRDIEICGIQRGIFDRLLEPWREHAHLIGLKEFTGRDPVPQVLKFLKDHAEGREKPFGQEQAYSFDVSEQELVPVLSLRTRANPGSNPAPKL